MSIKILFFEILVVLSFACSPMNSEKLDLGSVIIDRGPDLNVAHDTIIDNAPTLPDLFHCASDFSSCKAGVTLIVGEDKPNYNPFVAFSEFSDGTALVFNLEGEAETLVGDIYLADARVGRALPPMAGIVQPFESGPNGEIREIVWDTTGGPIQVEFPRSDFMKITYDLELFDILKLDRPHRYLKGEFTAPITVRCYTGVRGSGQGVRDLDFSSNFCQKYKKHNHIFPAQ